MLPKQISIKQNIINSSATKYCQQKEVNKLQKQVYCW